jgi:uncharacterized peroxidase-related enzyme
MSRIPAVDRASADPKSKPLLDAVNKAFGVTPNLFRVTAQSPAALEGLLGLSGALDNGSFKGKTREAIALAVAQANSCDYCLSAHTALGKRAGLSDAEVASARQGRASDPKTAAIVRFARLLVENSGHATDSELAQLHQAGVTEGEIIEIVANTVLNIFTNHLNHVAGTDIDFPVMRADVAAVA